MSGKVVPKFRALVGNASLEFFICGGAESDEFFLTRAGSNSCSLMCFP